MDSTTKSTLRRGFTLARWGIDICIGALFIAIALIISAFTGEMNLLKALMIPVAMCVVGLIVFAIGRVTVGLQSRKLNLHTSRPLTDEEAWFVGCMLEIEETGAGVNFYNAASRMTPGSADNMAAGAMASAIVGRFFKIGKHFMGKNFLMNRLPAILSLLVAVVIVVINVM